MGPAQTLGLRLSNTLAGWSGFMFFALKTLRKTSVGRGTCDASIQHRNSHGSSRVLIASRKDNVYRISTSLSFFPHKNSHLTLLRSRRDGVDYESPEEESSRRREKRTIRRIGDETHGLFRHLNETDGPEKLLRRTGPRKKRGTRGNSRNSNQTTEAIACDLDSDPDLRKSETKGDLSQE